VRVGIVGGGQLGRMLALAGHDLGIACISLDPAKDSPAAQVAPAIVGEFGDEPALEQLARRADVITYEFENVPLSSARRLAGTRPVFPPPPALEAAQDRLAEKALFGEVGIPVAPLARVDDLETLRTAIDAVGLPAVLKTRRLGYDGKGQAAVHRAELAQDAWRAVGEVPSILEALVPFERELSIIGARGRDGETRFWPLVENRHRDGILRTSIAPAPRVSAHLQTRAERFATDLMLRLDYIGVLAIELFDVGGGAFLGNEMAPRVHNSGHWTIEGAETSQFDQHLRAISGLPLGSAAVRGCAAMVNLIGEIPDERVVLSVPGARLHLYGKRARPGRKLGHVTVTADDAKTLRARVLQVLPDPADA
jgi:5-(carboxyamino)imidazole ribonucleotide synthase